MNLRYKMFCRIISSVWKLTVVKVKHCGLLPLTKSEAGAYDRKILWKTQSVMIGKIVNFLKTKDADLINVWYFISQSCCGTLGTAVNEGLDGVY